MVCHRSTAGSGLYGSVIALQNAFPQHPYVSVATSFPQLVILTCTMGVQRSEDGGLFRDRPHPLLKRYLRYSPPAILPICSCVLLLNAEGCRLRS